MTRAIDLNADMGEYSDAAGEAAEAALMAFVTSCSIACGGHAGDEATMRATIRRAKAAGVSIGAHPSYPDREGFGRRSIDIDDALLRASLEAQLASLNAIAKAEGAELSHVKAHGALYNDAARTDRLATLVAEAAASAERLILVGPQSSALERAAKAQSIAFAAEGFVDRLYRRDGSLTPRSEEGAIIADINARAHQALAIAQGEVIKGGDGELRVNAQTLCIHSDSPSAVETAKAVRAALSSAGISVRALA